ncbi:hypothetical protein C4D60_Mb03t22020 [Musa balbisiana]|uniref:Uncharacterized protein n=1 Tax=Musa balbisiana TaxID=52838 RepID=A0A4S8JC11_MUSBA|nr:hypothetical protein C4D60_Mb03t22020 [Musa balbisiana]
MEERHVSSVRNRTCKMSLRIQTKHQADIILHGRNRGVAPQLEEDQSRDEAIGARLVGDPDPLDPQQGS